MTAKGKKKPHKPLSAGKAWISPTLESPVLAPDSTKETVKPEVGTLYVPAHGRGLLRYGGTNRGGGRTPDATKAMFRDLISQPDVDARLEALLRAGDPELFLRAHAYCTEKGYGKLAAAEGDQSGRQSLTIRLVRERSA